MITDIIDKEFAIHIKKRGMWVRMGITREHQKTLRAHLRQGHTISLHKKARLLHRAGWRGEQYQYTRQDMVNAVKFCINASAAARGLGAEYVVEKYLAHPNPPGGRASQQHKASSSS